MVTFQLCSLSIRVSHYNKTLNDLDEQDIYSVSETSKELTDIGRFGIFFKSF